MDARTYFDLTDAIAAATERGELEALRERVDDTEMHPMERRVLERVLRSRLDMLRLGEIVVPRPKPERADWDRGVLERPCRLCRASFDVKVSGQISGSDLGVRSDPTDQTSERRRQECATS